MLEVKRVLVPVDFSAFSKRALAACAQILSGETVEEIHFLYVWRPPSDGVTYDDPEPALRDKLARFVADFAPVGDATVTLHVVTGHPATAICDFAEQHRCDLIVISTHGRTGLERMLIGSTAEQVVRHAPRPVLTLRAPTDT